MQKKLFYNRVHCLLTLHWLNKIETDLRKRPDPVIIDCWLHKGLAITNRQDVKVIPAKV